MNGRCALALVLAMGCPGTFELEVPAGDAPFDGGAAGGRPFECAGRPVAPSPSRVVLVGDGTRASCTETAVRRAVAQGGGVSFDCGPGVAEIEVTRPIALGSGVLIDGDGQVRFSGGDQSRIFTVEGELAVLRRISIAQGRAERGGGLVVQGGARLWLDEVVFTSNEADGGTAPGARPLAGGGAVHVEEGGELIAIATNFLNNQSSFGGALWLEGRAGLHGVRFRQNIASQDGLARGGAIAAFAGDLVLCDAELQDNRAGTGGAVYAELSQLRVEQTLLAENIASDGDSRFGGGGAVAVTDSSGRIEASEFRANTAGRSGGGLRMEGGGLRISNSTFDSNVSSAEDGTAIFSSGGEHEVHHVTFVGVGLRPLVSGEGLALFNSVLQSASAPCSGMFPGEGVAHSPGPPCVEGATTLDEMGLQRVATGCGNLGAFVPEPSSPLRGAGVAAFCTESDQCGNARPAARCTLGAVEDN